MRARRIGRAYRMHDRQIARIVNRLERRERRMQPEEAVQIDGRIRVPSGCGIAMVGPQIVVALFAMRDHHVQSVTAPRWKIATRIFLARAGRIGRIQRAREPRRRRPDAEHRHGRTLEKNSSGRHIRTPISSENPAIRAPSPPPVPDGALGILACCDQPSRSHRASACVGSVNRTCRAAARRIVR